MTAGLLNKSVAAPISDWISSTNFAVPAAAASGRSVVSRNTKTGFQTRRFFLQSPESVNKGAIIPYKFGII